MKVVILAGGLGTRMGNLTRDVPKAMLPVAGRPLLEYQIELARRYGYTDVHVLTGYKSDVIERHFGDGSSFGVRITYTVDPQPLGTAGAVKQIEALLDDDFLVFYGDVMMDVDLAALVSSHREHGALATIVVHPNDHPHDSDLVEVDQRGRVTAFHAKPHTSGAPHRNLVSAALYVMASGALPLIPGTPSDFGRDVLPSFVREGKPIFAYRTREYLKDVGTVQRVDEVDADARAGRVRKFHRANALGAIFLDRDGVLNADDEPVTSPSAVRLLPGVADGIRQINRSDRLAIVITNQPLIAKGVMSERELDAVHAQLETLLGQNGAYLDELYYCPHHPDGGYAGERPEYKIDCDCRKPRTGMIDRAVAELNVDLADSFVIGDRTVDVQTGINAGITTILVRTGEAGADRKYDCEPDFVSEDLAEAVRFVNDRRAVRRPRDG